MLKRVACVAFAALVGLLLASGALAQDYTYLSQFGLGQFNQPFGIAIDPTSHNIVVVDDGAGRVRIFSSTGVFLSEIGGIGSGNGQFSSPTTVAIDPTTHNIVVLDAGNRRVQIFSSAGAYLSQFGTFGSGDGQFFIPFGIAIDPVSHNIIVADTGNNRVQIFNSAGVYQSQFGSFGNGNGQFNLPYGVAIDPTSHNIIVADTGNNRVQIFSSAGVYLSKFGMSGSGSLQFADPFGVAIDPTSHNIVVIDTHNNRVQIFSSSGVYQSQFGSSGNGDGQIISPYGIAIDPTSHNIIVADAGNSRVQIFAPGPLTPLIDQGNGTVLDTSTNLLWLKDANYAATELQIPGRIAAIIANVGSIAGHPLVAGDFDATTGRMTWWGAMAWAQDLTFAGLSDWRLSTVTDKGAPGCDMSNNNTDCGYNVDPATGELARLWYVALANTASADTSGNSTGCGFAPLPSCFTNTSPFVDAQSFAYWSGTTYAPDGARAWYFNTRFGFQDAVNGLKIQMGYAWVVRQNGPAPTVPVISSLSPTSMVADGVAHTLTINGSNFISGNQVQFNFTGSGGWVNSLSTPSITSNLITISMNPGTATDTIFVRVCRSASQTTSSDCSAETRSVSVIAPGTGFTGGTVSANYDWPNLGTVLYPSGNAIVGPSVEFPSVGGQNVSVDFSDTGFRITYPVGWLFNTTDPKTFDGWVISDVLGTIPNITGASLAGTNIPGYDGSQLSFDANHVYVNQLGFSGFAAGSFIDVAVSFESSPPTVPVITLLDPTSMTADGLAHTLTINGSNFIGGNQVQFNFTGSGGWVNSLSTPTIASNQITISINPGIVTDTIYVRVCRSASQTTTSDCSAQTASVSVTAVVSLPVPTISSLSPTSMTADGVAHTLSINGSNFASGNQVQFNFTGSGGWVNALSSPTIAANQITISMNPGTVTDTISVRVCRSASQTTTSDCSSQTASVSVTAVLPTPTVTNLSPPSGPVASPVVVGGTNFGAAQGMISLCGVSSTTILHWEDTAVAFTVPQIDAGRVCDLVVMGSNGSVQATPKYTVTSKTTLSGRIANTAGGSLIGVQLILSGPAVAIVTTGRNGAYTSPLLPSGSYTVTPDFPGYQFTIPGLPLTIENSFRIVTLSGTGNVVGVDFVGALAFPFIANIKPDHGTSGTPVIVSGSGFGAYDPSISKLLFGSVPVDFQHIHSWSDIQIVADAPPNLQSVLVSVVTPQGTSNFAAFDYSADKKTPQVTYTLGPTGGYTQDLYAILPELPPPAYPSSDVVRQEIVVINPTKTWYAIWVSDYKGVTWLDNKHLGYHFLGPLGTKSLGVADFRNKGTVKVLADNTLPTPACLPTCPTQQVIAAFALGGDVLFRAAFGSPMPFGLADWFQGGGEFGIGLASAKFYGSSAYFNLAVSFGHVLTDHDGNSIVGLTGSIIDAVHDRTTLLLVDAYNSSFPPPGTPITLPNLFWPILVYKTGLVASEAIETFVLYPRQGELTFTAH